VPQKIKRACLFPQTPKRNLYIFITVLRDVKKNCLFLSLNQRLKMNRIKEVLEEKGIKKFGLLKSWEKATIW